MENKINSMSREEQLEAVKQDGYLIQYIDNPTEEMKLIAIKQNGYSIKFIENPTWPDWTMSTYVNAFGLFKNKVSFFSVFL